MRYRSFADVLWSHELELPMDWVFSFPPSVEEQARLAALFRRAERPSAVVCSSDLWALQLMRILERQGLRCPQDVAMVGMGDREFAAQLPVALTSVRFDLQGLVEHTVSAMVAILEDRPMTNERLGGELIVRESCGAG